MNKKINKKSRISRTNAIKVIKENGGKFMTIKFVKKDNSERTINCIMKNDSESKLGYLNVYSIPDKGYRNIDTRTIRQVNIDNKQLVVNG